MYFIIKFVKTNRKLKSFTSYFARKGLDSFETEKMINTFFKNRYFATVATTLNGLYGDSFLEKINSSSFKDPLVYGTRSKGKELTEIFTDYEFMNVQTILALIARPYVSKVQVQLDYTQDIEDLKNFK